MMFAFPGNSTSIFVSTVDLQSGCTPGPYQDIGVVVGLVIGCTVSIIIFSLVPLIACFIYFKQKNEVIPTNL